MPIVHAIQEVQVPLVAAMLLAGCSTKLVQTLRTGSAGDGTGPAALAPLRLRRPLALTLCAIEGGLGLGLIVTAGGLGRAPTATCIRLGAGLLFLVAASALIELRVTKPDVGCGCFGDFSTTPVSGRTIVRSFLLAGAALSTISLGAIRTPRTGDTAVELLAILCLELIVVGALSPEVGEGLIRLGYSEPCELRDMPAARTLAALRRSKQWRRYSGLITSDVPADSWRELCWRYVVYPCRYDGKDGDLVFAVYQQHRRPAVRAALVDSATGLPCPLPGTPAGVGRPQRPAPRPAWGGPGGLRPSD
jgi:hypothetical protein